VHDLVVRARDGDHDAFSELAARSIGRLTAAARMILRDEYGAQDAVQDTLFEAWRSLPGLRDPDRFDAWLRRLLVRACFARVRRRKAVREAEIRLTPADEPSTPGGERAIALHDQLERGMARLPAEQRAVVVLVYYLDLPLAEASQALGIPLGTTKSRLNRATHSMRSAIEADEREPSSITERFA
jgi:RNA polymerase sigma factor (sigma-70 family)